MSQIKKALISVWNKEGLLEFAHFLKAQNIEIISTGGTMNYLKDNGFEVTSVSSLTGSKQIMDGRVKTLHPKVFGGILADRNNASHLNDLKDIASFEIDLVVINLYPFEEEAVNKGLNANKAIEFIDIGGPSMLRAAAKNFQYVIPISDINMYSDFMKIYKENNGVFNFNQRKNFASIIFKLTSAYDSLIFDYLNENNGNDIKIDLSLTKKEELRYGENPHQKSNFYLPEKQNLILKQYQGKQLSYNNYFDIESAISIVYEFKEPCCSIIKHSNPCGFSIHASLKEAYLNSVKCDPISYFGGIVGFNREVDKSVAEELVKSFLECIVAPSFSINALEVFKTKKNLRIVSIEKDDLYKNVSSIKSVFNGFLVQDKDFLNDDESKFEVVSKIKPDNNQLKALYLSWKLVKYVKSNAIVFSNSEQVLAVGAGQMSRVDSTKIAINKANENNLSLVGSVMASDAFFPFPDCLLLAKEVGVVGAIQPGGSIKDKEVIEAADQNNMFMIFTNKRHFYH